MRIVLVRNQTSRSMTILVVILALLLTSCSGVQNREKSKASGLTDKDSSISLQVSSRTTTKGSVTTDGLDKDIEKKATKTISRVLISGSASKSAFASDAFLKAESTFSDNKKVKENSATISFHLMDNSDEANSVLAAMVSQIITQSNGKKAKKNGIIYLDMSGSIIGYDINNIENSSLDLTEDAK